MPPSVLFFAGGWGVGRLVSLFSAFLPSGEEVRGESASQVCAFTLHANQCQLVARYSASVLPCQCDEEPPHYLALNNSPPDIRRARSELATVSIKNGASGVATGMGRWLP